MIDIQNNASEKELNPNSTNALLMFYQVLVLELGEVPWSETLTKTFQIYLKFEKVLYGARPILQSHIPLLVYSDVNFKLCSIQNFSVSFWSLEI